MKVPRNSDPEFLKIHSSIVLWVPSLQKLTRETIINAITPFSEYNFCEKGTSNLVSFLLLEAKIFTHLNQ